MKTRFRLLIIAIFTFIISMVSFADVTVHLYKPATWSNTPTLYYWNTSPAVSAVSWPGVTMALENGAWYKYTIAGASSTSLIFSNKGSNQTANLSRNKEGWYKNNVWYDANPDDAVAPTASLTAPTSGTVTGSITVSATASDNIAVAKVLFYAGSALIGTDTAAPYSISWGTSGVANGTYALTAVAYDAAGNTGKSTAVSVTVSNTITGLTIHFYNASSWTTPYLYYWGTTPATTSVTWPGAAMTSEGSRWYKYTIVGATSSKIIFSNKGSSQTADLSRTGDGWYKNGTWYNTNPDDSTPPVATLTAPAAGTVKGNVTVSATASDNVGVTKVEFYQGTILIGTDTTSPYSVTWDTTGVANGNYAVKAVAYDAAALTGTSTVSVTVSNTVDTTAPTVYLVAPASGTVSGTTTINATATDNVGVTKVEFYQGTVLIGTDTTSPYSITWDTTGVANGTYIITAKAYDAAGNTAVSQPGNITVSNTVTGLKVHYKNSSSWTTPYIYYWSTTPVVTVPAWPGVAMTAESTSWYTYTITGATSSKIIFSNKGSSQTADLSRAVEGWYADGVWYDSDPDIDTTPPVVTASPDAGRYEAASLAVTLTVTDNKDTAPSAYYTLDGTTPTKASAKYSGILTISGTSPKTIKVLAVDAAGNSKVYTFVYYIGVDATPPVVTASPAAGRYDNAQSITFTIKDNKDTAPKLYYTTDGTEATISSTLYKGETIAVSKTMTIKTLAADVSGNKISNVFAYTIGKVTARTDFREETVYFLLPTRFYDGDSSNNRYQRVDSASGNLANKDPGWRGDFKGLIAKLDYIKALGFTAIWITPPVLNRSDADYHGYHAWDMSKIDGRLESPGATYQDLINACHAKGIKIMQDIVINHSSRYGEKNLNPPKLWGDSADPQWGNGTKMDYYDEYNPDFVYDGVSIEPKSGKNTYNGDTYQKEKPTNLSWNPNLSAWGTKTQWTSPEGYAVWNFQWPDSSLALYNPKYYHSDFLKNWEDYTCQTGTIHPDCIDINTESKDAQDYLIKVYTDYINMGVDAFRIDTAKHVSRVMFNRRFVPAFKQAGGENFYMTGEVLTKVYEIWNKGVAPLSAPFYTWKERKTYSADDTLAAKEGYDYENAQGVGSQPTSMNHYLNGNAYHTPDHAQQSGLDVIDCAMHVNFADAHSAFNVKSNDVFYNDATSNLVYVDSHDYGPSTSQNRYAGGQDAWAENISLMWTFRGIPTLFYGSEVQFQAGMPVDGDPNKLALANSGRAYFGDKIEGSVTTTDFGVYSNATGAMAAALSNPVAKHLSHMNRIRRAIPALQKGQYSTDNVDGSLAFKKRYTNASEGIDSFVLVTISGGATFKGIPGGKYVDVVTGDTQTIAEGGTLTASCSGQGNLRVYVLNGTGKITGISPYLK